MNEEPRYTLEEAHKKFAKELHGEVWSLLEKTRRSKEDAEIMKYAAYASCYHWLHAGTRVNQQRGEWLIARVHITLEETEAALQHARRCLELTLEHADEMEDFDLPFAHECISRAESLAGNTELAVKHYQLAEETGEKIKDEEDKKIFFEELNKNLR